MSNAPLQAPRGTYDALPEQAARLRHIESTALAVLSRYGFGEIRTPVFEFTDVFARNVGDSTDIVSKEMYSFPDRGGESLTLRPEGTAPVVRAYYEHGLKQHLPLKLAYVGAPMFRYERPQKGRYRQFHQIGVEVLGYAGAWADVECIAAGVAMLRALGIASDGVMVRLNSLGGPEDRAIYRDKLMDYLVPLQSQLSRESQERLAKNPLRILDSKEPEDAEIVKNAPRPVDTLSEPSRQHFAQVMAGLSALNIPYEIVPTLVRGLDYYTHTVFEIHGVGLGAQSQVIGGGRYDGLISQMGGEAVPAVGWGCGLERLDMLMPKLPEPKADVAILVDDEAARLLAMKASETLRSAGFEVVMALDPLSMKAQQKHAADCGVWVVIGAPDVADSTVTVKRKGKADKVTLDALVAAVRG